MKYQVVMQFTDELEGGFDKLIEIEDIFIENISSIAEVDGHDVGDGQMNIFILTDYPVEVINKILMLLSKDDKITNKMTAAYRKANEDKFNFLWPENLSSFEVT